MNWLWVAQPPNRDATIRKLTTALAGTAIFLTLSLSALPQVRRPAASAVHLIFPRDSDAKTPPRQRTAKTAKMILTPVRKAG